MTNESLGDDEEIQSHSAGILNSMFGSQRKAWLWYTEGSGRVSPVSVVLWSGGPGTGASLQKSSIEEANRHLKALMERVEELESVAHDQADQLVTKDKHIREIVESITRKSELEIKRLSERLSLAEERELNLKSLLTRREEELTDLTHKCRLFDDLIQYRATLNHLAVSLNQAAGLPLATSDGDGCPLVMNSSQNSLQDVEEDS